MPIGFSVSKRNVFFRWVAAGIMTATLSVDNCSHIQASSVPSIVETKSIATNTSTHSTSSSASSISISVTSWSDNFNAGAGHIEDRAGWSSHTYLADGTVQDDSIDWANDELETSSSTYVGGDYDTYNLADTNRPSSADYYAKADVITINDGIGDSVIVRATSNPITKTLTGYIFYGYDGFGYVLGKWLNGTYYALSNATNGSFDNTVWRTYVLQVSGSNPVHLEGFVDGIKVISYDDDGTNGARITSTGQAGLIFSIGSPGEWMKSDNFSFAVGNYTQTVNSVSSSFSTSSSSPVLSEVLVASDVSHSQTASGIQLIYANNLLHSQTVSIPTTLQIYSLSVNNATHSESTTSWIAQIISEYTFAQIITPVTKRQALRIRAPRSSWPGQASGDGGTHFQTVSSVNLTLSNISVNGAGHTISSSIPGTIIPGMFAPRIFKPTEDYTPWFAPLPIAGIGRWYPSSCTHGQASASPSIIHSVSVYTVGPSNASNIQTVSASLVLISWISIQSGTILISAGQPNVAHIHIITPISESVNQNVSDIQLIFTHSVLFANTVHDQSCSEVVLNQNTNINNQNRSHAQTVSTPVLNTSYILYATDPEISEQDQSCDIVPLIEVYLPISAPTVHGQNATNPTLLTGLSIAPSDGLFSIASRSVILTLWESADSDSHVQSVTEPAIYGGSVTLIGCTHVQSVSPPVLSMIHVIDSMDGSLAQSCGIPSVSANAIVDVDTASSLLASDSPTLVEVTSLVSSDCLHLVRTGKFGFGGDIATDPCTHLNRVSSGTVLIPSRAAGHFYARKKTFSHFAKEKVFTFIASYRG